MKKKITYASFICYHCQLEDEIWRIRLVVGGDKLPYELDSGSAATDLLEIKLIINSVISDTNIGARFLSMDLKDMFLHIPTYSLEFMKVTIKYFPQDVIEKYNLNGIVHNGYIFIKIKIKRERECTA